MVMWMFHAFKIVELLDTMFIIARNQLGRINALHVYHHTSALMVTWLAVKFVPGGSGKSHNIKCLVKNGCKVLNFSRYAQEPRNHINLELLSLIIQAFLTCKLSPWFFSIYFCLIQFQNLFKFSNVF